jgi:hypothetical protein
MKFKVGDRVQIVSDISNNYPEYIGYFANITYVDSQYEFPYELEIFDVNDKVIDECLCWEEEGLISATPEEVNQRAEENLRKFNEIDDVITKAAEYAGITKEQAYKFMDGFNK